MERKSDGGVVFRLARAEEKEEARHSGRKQKAMEVLYAKIQAEFEQEDIGTTWIDFYFYSCCVQGGSYRDSRSCFEHLGTNHRRIPKTTFSPNQIELCSFADRKRQLRRRTVSHRDIGSSQDGQELYEAVGDDLAGLEVTKYGFKSTLARLDE